MLFADVDERHEPVIDFLKFGLVFLIGVFQMFESAGRIDIVAWIDAYFLGIACSYVGYIGIEMDISHERSGESFFAKSGTDVLHVLCLSRALCGEAYQFAPCFNDTL